MRSIPEQLPQHQPCRSTFHASVAGRSALPRGQDLPPRPIRGEGGALTRPALIVHKTELPTEADSRSA